MVLVGKVNKDIVLLINRHGQPAVGLCGDDGLLFRAARQASPSGQDIGFVGRIERVDVDVLNHVASDYIPVVASVGADREGNSYNINADEAAGAVARALGAYKMMFLTDVAGWMRDRARPLERCLRGHGGGGRRPPCRASTGACGRSSPRASTRSTAASRTPTSSTAAYRTRCCSSCSPTPGRAPRSARLGRRVAGRAAGARARLRDPHLRPQPGRVRARRGLRLWDADGNEYLDFLAGISVLNVGHCHPAVVAAVREQVGRLTHATNLYYTEPGDAAFGGALRRARSAARCSCATPAPRPTRRRSSWSAGRAPGARSWSSQDAFHGRTYGALSATPQESKQAPFAPLVPGFVVVPKDPAALAAAVDERYGGGAARADPGRERHQRARRRAAARRARGLRPRRRGARVRRDPDRHGPHRARCGPTSRPRSCPTR